MAEMKAKRQFKYAGKPLTVGETFYTKNDRDALALEAVGRAVRTNKAAEKEAKAAARRGKYQTKVETAAPLVPEAKTDSDRFYGRRDMQAEGSKE